MGFEVNLPALRAVPDMLDRLIGDAQACGDYAENTYARMDDSGQPNFRAGLINRLAGNHARIRGEVQTFFGNTQRVGGAERDAVAASVEQYETTDLARCAALDALIKPTPLDPALHREPHLQPGWLQVRVAEQAHPRDALRPLPDYRAEYPYEPQWSDLLSPASLARDAVWGMTALAAKVGLCERAYDPVEEWTVPLVGDWAGLRACGEALSNLSRATSALGANAVWIGLRVEGSWQGNAADACWDVLHRTDVAINAAPDVFTRLGAAYLRVVEDVRELEELLEFAIVELLDWVVDALLSVETEGVAMLLVPAHALANLRRVSDAVAKIMTTYETLKLAIENGDSVLSKLGLVEANAHLPAVPALR